jgi:hypothetical protein
MSLGNYKRKLAEASFFVFLSKMPINFDIIESICDKKEKSW